MGLIKVDGERELMCPYLNIRCPVKCPAWIAPLDDCAFNVCLTQVKESFLAAAQYLDERLDLADGVGMQTMSLLRQVIKGEATEQEKEIVRSALTGLLSGAVLMKVSTMTVQDIADLLGRAESKISFAFDKLFGSDDPGGPEIS